MAHKDIPYASFGYKAGELYDSAARWVGTNGEILLADLLWFGNTSEEWLENIQRWRKQLGNDKAFGKAQQVVMRLTGESRTFLSATHLAEYDSMVSQLHCLSPTALEKLLRVAGIKGATYEDFRTQPRDGSVPVWESTKDHKWTDLPSKGLSASKAAPPSGRSGREPSESEPVSVVPILPEALHFGLRLGPAARCFNLILEGVPGTGKTFSLQTLREKTKADYGQGRFAMTMHPATSYEDFVEGLRPGPAPEQDWWTGLDSSKRSVRISAKANEFMTTSDEGWLALKQRAADTFTVHDGFFVRVCREAVHFPDKTFVVLLDEINRCNIPKVMGDLLTTIEPAKRARWVVPGDGAPSYWDTSKAQVVTLPYSQRSFFVPDNIIVIGTMNTTDRSVAPMDAALRRRFAFARVYPLGFDSTGLVAGDDDIKAAVGKLQKAVPLSWALWKALNVYLQSKFGDDAMLGHSYLHALEHALGGLAEAEDKGNAIARSHWNLYIFPQLIDVLVSNDLVDEVLKVKDKAVDVEASFDEDVRKAAQAFGGMKIEMRGAGLLRTPVIQL